MAFILMLNTALSNICSTHGHVTQASCNRLHSPLSASSTMVILNGVWGSWGKIGPLKSTRGQRAAACAQIVHVTSVCLAAICSEIKSSDRLFTFFISNNFWTVPKLFKNVFQLPSQVSLLSYYHLSFGLSLLHFSGSINTAYMSQVKSVCFLAAATEGLKCLCLRKYDPLYFFRDKNDSVSFNFLKHSGGQNTHCVFTYCADRWSISFPFTHPIVSQSHQVPLRMYWLDFHTGTIRDLATGHDKTCLVYA